MRTLAECFAGKELVQKRHQLTAEMVLCGALCLPLLFLGILDKKIPQIKSIFDVWYGGMCFFAGMIVLMAGWELFCILFKRWYAAMLLSLCVITGGIIILLQWS